VVIGSASSTGESGQASSLKLCWSPKVYTRNSDQFAGFFSGEGNRTPIPREFFTHVVPNKRLSVTKVVGTVLRHTVGYQNQYGGFRPQAPLSYSHIQRCTNISDRSTLSSALNESLDEAFICRMNDGCFHPDGDQRQTAEYAVNWFNDAMNPEGSSRTRPALAKQFKNQTSGSSKTRPKKQFKNQTSRKIDKKYNYKQQDVVEKYSEGFQLLVEEGITTSSALQLAESVPLVEIKKQIEWLDHRQPENRPAMLRKSIEENWSEPEGVNELHNQQKIKKREDQEAAERIEHEAVMLKQQQERQKRRQKLLALWRKHTKQDQRKYCQMARTSVTSDLQRKLIKQGGIKNPTSDVLKVMAKANNADI
jgi:hypothetical protein